MRVHFYIPVSLGGGGDGGNTTIALSSFISSLIIRAEDTAMGREEHRSKGKNERYKSIRQEGEGWRWVTEELSKSLDDKWREEYRKVVNGHNDSKR